MKKMSIYLCYGLLSVFLTGCAAMTTRPNAVNQSNFEFTAFGNQNGSWRAVIKDNRILAEAETLGFKKAKVQTLMDKDSIRFVEITNKTNPIILVITSKQCIDDNQNKNPYTATMVFKGQAYNGCAVPIAYETADT